MTMMETPNIICMFSTYLHHASIGGLKSAIVSDAKFPRAGAAWAQALSPYSSRRTSARPGIRRSGRRPPAPPAPVPKARHYPLPKLPRSPLRFLPGLGMLMGAAGLVDHYRRKPKGVEFPRNLTGAWIIRHGPNSYPGGSYAHGVVNHQQRKAHIDDPPFGPETGKIIGQASTAGSRYPVGADVPAHWDSLGFWIGNAERPEVPTRFASYMALQRRPDYWPTYPEGNPTIDGWEPVRDYMPYTAPVPLPLELPARYPMPSPHAVPPGQFVPLPRAVPSPSWPAPSMPAPLAPRARQPGWGGPGNQAPAPPSSVPAETLTAGPGGIRHNPNGRHMKRPPRKGEKEKKGKSTKVAFRIGDLMGQATEVMDIFDAAYKATPVPNHRKTWYRGKDVTSAKDRMALVWEFAGDLSIDEFVKQLLIQHVQDEVLGRVSQQAEKALAKNRLRGVSRLSRLGSVAGM